MREAGKLLNENMEKPDAIFNPVTFNESKLILLIEQSQTEAYNEAIRDAAERVTFKDWVGKDHAGNNNLNCEIDQQSILSLLKK